MSGICQSVGKTDENFSACTFFNILKSMKVHKESLKNKNKTKKTMRNNWQITIKSIFIINGQCTGNK